MMMFSKVLASPAGTAKGRSLPLSGCAQARSIDSRIKIIQAFKVLLFGYKIAIFN